MIGTDGGESVDDIGCSGFMRFWKRGPSRSQRARLNDLLETTYVYEDKWHMALLSSQVKGMIDFALDQMLTTREDRVKILRALGRTKEAEELAADTAMRREWVSSE